MIIDTNIEHFQWNFQTAHGIIMFPLFFVKTKRYTFFLCLDMFQHSLPPSCDVSLSADVSGRSRRDGLIVWSVSPTTSSITWWSLKERISRDPCHVCIYRLLFNHFCCFYKWNDKIKLVMLFLSLTQFTGAHHCFYMFTTSFQSSHVIKYFYFHF